MKRLIENNKNTPEEYDRIFEDRLAKPADSFDMKRWGLLIKKFKGGKIVDLGCLDSQIPYLLRSKFPYPDAEYWGIDLSRQAIRIMSLKAKSEHYLVRDVYQTQFESNFFDYAVAGELIEHLERPRVFFYEVFRILKPGGILALSTPLDELKGAVDADRHLWSYAKGDIKDLLKIFGKVKIKTLGSEYFPKYKHHHKVIIAYIQKYL